MPQTLKNIMLLAVFMAVVVFGAMAAHAQTKPPLMVPEGKIFVLSYQLDDKDHSFWNAIHDGVRAGRQVMVAHTVKISKKRLLINKTLGKKVWRKFVVYNLFENAYSYGATEKNSRRTTRQELVQNYVMGVVDVPFVARHKLEPGETYTITISLEVTEKAEEESWLKYLPFTDIFKQKLTRSFTYVAPEQ